MASGSAKRRRSRTTSAYRTSCFKRRSNNQHAVAHLKEKYGEANVANNAGGHQGREQYGPQRYLYVNVCDHTRAAEIVATHFHFHAESQGSSRKRARP